VKGQHSVKKPHSPLRLPLCLVLGAALALSLIGVQWARSAPVGAGVTLAGVRRLGPVPRGRSSTPLQRREAKWRGQVTEAVRAFLRGRLGTTEVAIESLKTHHVWIIRGGAPAPEEDASIVKVDILETLLSLTPPANPPLPPSLDWQAAEMIEDSDNDDANALWNDVGGQYGVDHYNYRIGLAHTVTSDAWGLTTSVPMDQLALLRNLVAPSHVLAKVQRRYALGLMEHVVADQRWGVSAGVPPNATVALKNGWLPNSQGIWQTNSIGWVDGDRRDYLIAVMSTGNPSEAYGIATIEGISKRVSPRMTRV
jgi:hypothetical protein